MLNMRLGKLRLIHSIILLILILGESAFAASNQSFAQAKRWLENNIYYDHRVTIYCGASYGRNKRISLPNGFATPAHAKRSYRME